MATAAFKSTTKRSSLGGGTSEDSNSSGSRKSNPDSGNAAIHRRSRSVSRFSHRLPVELADFEQTPAKAPRSRGKFVNTNRGSEFPEISLDDLAIELFSSIDFDSRGRTNELEARNGAETRRGRSVSRKEARVSDRAEGGTGDVGRNGRIENGRLASDATSRRRRSLSVARYHQPSDSETDGRFDKYTVRAKSKKFNGENEQKLQKPATSSQQRGLRNCASQRDMLKSYDDFSSHSSALTDDEAKEAWYCSDGIDKTLRNRHKKAEDCSMRTKLRHSVDDTRVGVEQVRISSKAQELVDSSDLQLDHDVLKAVSAMRRSYKTELEESEKHKQELLAKIMIEEQRGKELQKIVGGMQPDAKQIAGFERPSRPRKKSKDRRRISKLLVEDADKIIEDFISSVEDTDISSFDGERSDTSSVFGFSATKPKDVLMQFGEAEDLKSAASARSDFLPMATDGVILPWLEWETGNDGSPLPCRDEKPVPATTKVVLEDAPEVNILPTEAFYLSWDLTHHLFAGVWNHCLNLKGDHPSEDASMVRGQEQVQSAHSSSSRGSWSPGLVDSFSIDSVAMSRTGEPYARKSSQLLSNVPRKSRMDIDEYLKTPSSEDFLFERWKHREQISSGGLLICHNPFGSFLI